MKIKSKLLKLSVAIILLLTMIFSMTSCEELLDAFLEEYDSLNSDSSESSSWEEPNYEIPEGTVEFHFIDIDQGDSILILVNEKAILIDTGVSSQKDELDAYLAGLGITELEYFIATHPDADHIGGADHVVETYKINNIILSPKEHTTKTYERFITAIETKVDNGEIAEENVRVADEGLIGQSIYVGELEMKILGPLEPEDYNKTDNNNPSVVIMARWGNNKVLLTGDAEKEAEIKLVEAYGSQLDCDVLKVGHHGSHSSTHSADPENGITYGFLHYVQPEMAIISCGVDNDYGHPHQETLDELAKYEVEVLRTDLLGSIVLVSDGETITQKQ